jgi:hypothetical protein
LITLMGTNETEANTTFASVIAMSVPDVPSRSLPDQKD